MLAGFRLRDVMVGLSGKARIACSFAIALIVTALTLCIVPIEFYTNDDTTIQAILSGAVSGAPTPYAIFINVLAGAPICALFQIVPDVPWWLVFLEVTEFISVAFFSFASMTLLSSSHETHVGSAQIILLVTIASACFFAYFIARPSFTFSAASLSAGAVTSYLALQYCSWKRRESQRGLAAAVAILLCASYCLRAECGLIGIALVGITWALVILRNRFAKADREGFSTRYSTVAIMASMAMAAASWGINAVAYSSDEWVEFQEVNHARSTYMDFPHPSYDESSSAYRQEGWSEDLYILVNNWFFMDERVDADAFKALSGEFERSSFRSLASNAAHGTGMFAEPLALGLEAALMSILALSLIFERRRWPLRLIIVPVAVAFMGLFALWLLSRPIMRAQICVLLPAAVYCWSLALLAEWSPPRRLRAPVIVALIALTIFAVMALLLIALRLSTSAYMVFLIVLAPCALGFFCLASKGPARHFRAAVMVVMLLACLAVGAGSARQLFSEVDSRAELASRADDVMEYAEHHPDEKFVTTFHFENAYPIPPRNIVAWGGWEYYAPWRKEVANQWGHPDGLYVDILFDDGVYFLTVEGNGLPDNLQAVLSERNSVSVSYESVEKLASGIAVYKFDVVDAS